MASPPPLPAIPRDTSAQPAAGRWRRWWHGLLAPDVFIAYARADGFDHALALAHQLGARGLSVQADLFGSEPGLQTPPALLRAAARARVMVLVATPAALASAAVRQEVEAFAPQRPLLPICLGTPAAALGSLSPRLLGLASSTAPWPDDGTGAARHPQPEPAQLDRIEAAVGRWRQARRLRWSSGLALALIASALGVLLWSQQQNRALSAQRDRLTADLRGLEDRRAQAQADNLRLQAEAARLQNLVQTNQQRIDWEQSRVKFANQVTQQLMEHLANEPALQSNPEIACHPGRWPPPRPVLIPFAGQQASVSAHAELLDQLASCAELSDHPLLLYWTGDPADSQPALVRQRLQAVAQHLRRQGLPAARIRVEADPAAARAAARQPPPALTGVAIEVQR